MKPIGIFYHCLFQLEEEILPVALDIVHEQMTALKNSGLLHAAAEMVVGCNGGEESRVFCEAIIPVKAKVTFHGLQCHNECRTIRLIEQWLPGHEDWYVFYFHTKGACHPPGDPLRTAWRDCMMRHLVDRWRWCVSDLDRGYDAVGCHWKEPPETPPTQYIFAGNFWWAKASFLRTLPSITERERIKVSGIDALESRFEAEVILGNGKRVPRIWDYHRRWRMSIGGHP